jgi:hypothetical protein
MGGNKHPKPASMKTTRFCTPFKSTLLAAFFALLPATSQASLQFKGSTGSYATMSQSFLGGATVANFTIEFWVKNKRPEIDQQLGGKTEYWKEWAIVFPAGGAIQFFHAWPNTYYGVLTTNGVMKPNQWQHVAVVGQGTLGSLYVDGALVQQQNSLRGQISFNAAASASSVAGFLLGFRDNTTLADDLPFLGDLADYRVWDVALTGAQIASLHSSAPATNAPGLRHWLPFKEGSGSTFADIVGGLQGQLFNTAWGTDDPQPLFCSPHRATAITTLFNGFVVGATITDPGCGYSNAPVVLIQGGGGSGAAATTVVNDGKVVAITITSAGSGYTEAPRIRIASPPFEPSVSISVSRVQVTSHVVLGRSYVLESSPDLSIWMPVGPQFTADSEEIVNEFDVQATGRHFRLRQVP